MHCHLKFSEHPPEERLVVISKDADPVRGVGGARVTAVKLVKPHDARQVFEHVSLSVIDIQLLRSDTS